MAELAPKNFKELDNAVQPQALGEEKSRLVGMVDDIKLRAEQGLHKIEEKISPSFQSSKDALRQATRSTTQWAKQNPIYATLAVAAVGVLIGMAVKRARR